MSICYNNLADYQKAEQIEILRAQASQMSLAQISDSCTAINPDAQSRRMNEIPDGIIAVVDGYAVCTYNLSVSPGVGIRPESEVRELILSRMGSLKAELEELPLDRLVDEASFLMSHAIGTAMFAEYHSPGPMPANR